MAVRTILKYPDPGLSRACLPVTAFDADLTTLAHDLLDTMPAAPGVGITAAHGGAFREEDADGFYAICMQHEVDQLDGIFWLKRLSRLKRDRLLRKWEKQK